jgi:tetraacyldisaccharide 4'-kinase
VVVRLRLWGYGNGVFQRRSLPGFVISIGNLTTGGTGKTPAVVETARWAVDAGYRVAVLSRGYGRRSGARVLVVSDGQEIKVTPAESGDEPFLLATRLHRTPVVISRKRYWAGLYAHHRFGCNFFVLDDGFQHLGLRRDLDIVLMDGRRPLGNGHLLPLGPLREAPSQLARADAFVLTRLTRSEPGDQARAFLKERFPGIPVYASEHEPVRVVFPSSDQVWEADVLEGKRVVAFAGIAQPQAFRETLVRLKAEIVGFRAFQDHHRFKEGEIRSLVALKEGGRADCLLTTEKDWVRLRGVAFNVPGLGYLRIRFVIRPDGHGFFNMIQKHVEQRMRPNPDENGIG